MIRRLALCTLLLLTACSSPKPVTPATIESSPQTIFVQRRERPASLELPFIRILGKDEANLRWPKIGLHLEMIGASDAFPETPALEAGQEWVVAYIGDPPSGFTSKEFTDAVIKIGGQPHTVPAFERRAFIVVAAPKNAIVRLELTDTERMQWIDLRTAEVGNVIAGLHPKRRDGASIECGIASPTKAVHDSAALFSASGTLVPWVETRGWAKPGRVWLDLELGLWYSRNGIAITVDTPASVTLTGPEGPIPINVPLSLGGPSEDDPHSGKVQLVVDLPADVQVLQLAFQLKGTIAAKGAPVPQWSATCETVQDALAFNS